MTTAETTRKSLAAKLREARMHLNLHKKYQHKDKPTMDKDFAQAMENIGSAIIVLESSSESLMGLKEAVEVRREAHAKSEAFLSLRAESGDAEWERKHEISMIRLEECDRFLKLIAQAQKRAPREKLIEEREQASK